jgi:hypothetical protein
MPVAWNQMSALMFAIDRRPSCEDRNQIARIVELDRGWSRSLLSVLPDRPRLDGSGATHLQMFGPLGRARDRQFPFTQN